MQADVEKTWVPTSHNVQLAIKSLFTNGILML